MSAYKILLMNQLNQDGTKSMTNLTYADICMGYGGATQGAMDADLALSWGIEKDPDIAYWADKNFSKYKHQVVRKDVRDVDFNALSIPDWLHASPPCTTATVVNKKGESQEDIDLAKAVCRAIEILQPEYFSLENVAGYRNYKSYGLINSVLMQNHYAIFDEVFDCSDYGVPQSRKRLFLVASKNRDAQKIRNIPKVEKKVSWYDAIADLIPTLTPTTLTSWQRQAIYQKFLKDHGPWYIPDMVIQRSGARKKNKIPNNTIRLKDEPMFTIKAMSGKKRPSVKQATIVIDGQAYEADTRCLMRWQTFSDDYQTSGNLILDTKGFGNAVPPLMFSQIIRSVLNGN
jgi:DNA (cytosine-5)-methyltransferase 1